MRRSTKRKLKKAGYNAIQWSWGLPQTLAGAVLYLKHRNNRHFDYGGAKATVWEGDKGVSLGKYIFVPENSSEFLLDHEYGHTFQSMILGPLYLPLVGAPSMAWNRLSYFEKKRKKTGRSYYSAVFERTANQLGALAAASARNKKDTD